MAEKVMTMAERVVQLLGDLGVQRLFGMPGGGSNADLIEAAAKLGIPFSLAHSETASAMMAIAQAEISGKPGACIATLGPGVASIMNGVAQAFLDRVPLIVITDCHPESLRHMQHQSLCQHNLFAPVTKFSAEVRATNVEDVLSRAVQSLLAPPPGPVHLDISGEVTSSMSEGTTACAQAAHLPSSDCDVYRKVQQILGQMHRPVFFVGLAARTQEISTGVQQHCESFGIPALVTYKAKGVAPDHHRWFGGLLTNGALEREVLERADGFIAVGLDPVELLPKVWNYSQPVVSISAWHIDQQQVPIAAEIVGDTVELLQKITAFLPKRSDWSQSEVALLLEAQRAAMRPANIDGKLTPHRVVEVVAGVYGGSRISVDAGAHMFPVMCLWPAKEPCGVLISNGLSTMAFALPAAIGACLLNPSQPIVVFTGDGGLLMCLGELRTAARENLPLRIIVFDDSVLSLIKIKQIKRQYRTNGVTIGAVNWADLASSMGLLGRTATNEDELLTCLRETAACAGTVLIAAKISEETYPETLRALRG
ncbi:MAG: thiamine pyrophosphate-binding protein [Acidobacteriaceae bacterium]|nr:thiamine pyrophosphate-binding protein [Acidobacteriaceae bacterium]